MGVCVLALYTANSCGIGHVLMIWPVSLCFAEDLSDFIRHYGFAWITLYILVWVRQAKTGDGEAAGKSYNNPYSGIIYCS